MDDYQDFTPLLDYPLDKLLAELADTHSNIANLIIRVGFLRQEELRGTAGAKEARIEAESLQAAYTEKKWLLVKLIDYAE